MKTCRHCLSEDIPDAATHCRHCSRRVRPRISIEDKRYLAIVGLILLVFTILYVSVIGPALVRQDATVEAHAIIGTIDVWCSGQITSDERDSFSSVDQAKLDKLELGDDRGIIEAEYSNRMESLGCGPSAQKLRDVRARAQQEKKDRVAAIALSHRDGTIEVSSWPSAGGLWIDGERLGYTPARVTVEPGEYKIRITMPGYSAWEESVKVVAGQGKVVYVPLKKSDD